MKCKNFCTSKDRISRVKGNLWNGENICKPLQANKQVNIRNEISRIYKELPQSNNRKINNPVLKMGKTWIDICPKKIYKWPTNYIGESLPSLPSYVVSFTSDISGFPNTKQFCDTSWMSCNLTQFWLNPSGDSISSHKLSALSHKTTPACPFSDANQKSKLSPVLVTSQL